MTREKMPILSDFDPERVRPVQEERQIDTLFPHENVSPATRITHVERVLFDLVKAFIAMSPQVAASTEYINDETNARTSAMAHAHKTTEMLATVSGLMADVKKTQRVRENRSKYLYWALGAPVSVVLVGLWTKTEPAALATAVAAIAGVSIAIVNIMANRTGQTREGDSLRPPK